MRLGFAWHGSLRTGSSGGGGGVRYYSQFSAIFPQVFRSCFSRVPLACVLVPCVSPVQTCCPLRLRGVWVRHRSVSAISRNFSQSDLTLPDDPPPPGTLL